MLGKNLLSLLKSKNIDVIAPSSKELNLLDFQLTKAFLEKMKPHMIIHAAGRVGGIAANIAAPYEFLFENLEMGKNLIASAREVKTPQFLNFSSSCVYPRFGKNPLEEKDILNGELEPTNEGYALAKISVMRLGEFATKTGTLNFKSLIPCNLYGLHDHFDPIKSHLLPSIVMKIHQAKINRSSEVEIWGSGEARREFMFTGDLATITLDCVNKFEQLPLCMNIGIGRDYSINDYYQAASKVIGFTGTFKHDLSKPEGMKQKLVDNTRMTNLGLSAKTSLEEGIQQTYQFYLQTLESKA